ncbi:MAG: hypothetical protein WAO22_04100 [bacterium]|jgi:hypothetical protein|nr:hypothetical protein [Bacillota bacterium]
MHFESRITIFVGAFGSGKTEIAINYVRALAKQREKVAIVDMDIVSPYFRSRDVTEELTAQGIEVIVPPGELAQADLPIIVPRIKGAFDDPELHVVVDVGGDDIGATALGRFSDQLESLPHELLLVINTCRPFTKDVNGIKNMLLAIENATHLKVTGLVANSNLALETTPEVIQTGLEIIAAAGADSGIPVVGVGVREDLILSIGTLAAPIFPITITLLPPWYKSPVLARDRRSVMAAQAALTHRQQRQ